MSPRPITDRLREAALRHDRSGRGRTGHLMREAADEIDHLDAENDYLVFGDEDEEAEVDA